VPTVLTKDDRLVAPDFTVITASAGSGKTHTLTMRVLQLLLSAKIPHNALRNILAITYTHNAASEMRARIIDYLKSIALGNPARIAEVREIVSLDPQKLQEKAGKILDEIFEHYSDFHVQTIDSFTAGIFKSTSIEFGYTPDFEIQLQSAPLVDYAFDLFLKELTPGSPGAGQLERLAAVLSQAGEGKDSFPWNPYAKLSGESKDLYATLSSQTKSFATSDRAADLPRIRQSVIDGIRALEREIDALGFPRTTNYQKYAVQALKGNVEALVKKAALSKPVATGKVPKNNPRQFDSAMASLQKNCDVLNALVGEYAEILASTHYAPYLEGFSLIASALETVKRQNSQVFIGDIGKKLFEYLDNSVIPEIYLRLGERVFHFLIDEFQDTTPIQWMNMRVLIENALAQGGSLLVVGDTKQAIYGFTGADWRIMAEMRKQNIFPMAHHVPLELATNYRSYQKILDFTKEVFQAIVPNTDFAEAAARTGLSDFRQTVRDGFEHKGIVEVHRLDVSSDRGDEPAEKTKLLEIVRELIGRGYSAGDIAVLARKNTAVVRVSGWLNEARIPCISQSTLDIRRRKVIGELIALLRFLDSPIDDLSFATFILSDLFCVGLENSSNNVTKESVLNFLATRGTSMRGRNDGPLYAAFRLEFPSLWESRFEPLFNMVGYLPLYDLLTAIYSRFRVFEALPGEEASCVKLLEVITKFEAAGNNSLKDFLRLADDDNDEGWQIETPAHLDAVRLMTTHKAKGLQFPVVITLLYNSRTNSDFNHRGYYLDDSRDSVNLLRLNEDFAEWSPRLKQIYDEQRLRDSVNELNLLYVAFTRAEKELYVIGVDTFKQHPPINLLPERGYEPVPSKPRAEMKPRTAEPAIAPLHRFDVRSTVSEPSGALAFRETQRGDCLHKILSEIDYLDVSDVKSIIVRAIAEFRIPDSPETIESLLQAFFAESGVREFFTEQPGRTVHTEYEVSDAAGRLYRFDRIIIDPDKVTILDFKTGKESDAYRGQIRKYMSITAEIYAPRTVSGILAYIDLKKTVRVA